MRTRVLLSVGLVVVMMFAASQVFAEYDEAKVKDAMKTAMTAMGELGKAAESKDFYVAAEKLMALAQAFKSLESVTPEKGAKEEWDKNHQTLIKSAFKGIGACGEEDQEKLNAAIAEISGLMKAGHGMFK